MYDDFGCWCGVLRLTKSWLSKCVVVHISNDGYSTKSGRCSYTLRASTTAQCVYCIAGIGKNV